MPSQSELFQQQRGNGETYPLSLTLYVERWPHFEEDISQIRTGDRLYPNIFCGSWETLSCPQQEDRELRRWEGGSINLTSLPHTQPPAPQTREHHVKAQISLDGKLTASKEALASCLLLWPVDYGSGETGR